MPEYEYVTKREYKPVMAELEEIIRLTHRIMRKEHGVSFQHKLIGSGNRHLITREKNGNRGFDFDYNFIIPAPEYGNPYNAKLVKGDFMDALKKSIKGTAYKFPEDSTSAATIKVVNRRESRIEYSCDIAIVYYDDDYDGNRGYHYLKNYKNGGYGFEYRHFAGNVDEELEQILEYSNGWQMIREEYIKLKNRNQDLDKHSYVLYTEAVHNVLNHIRFTEQSENGHMRIKYIHNNLQLLKP